MVPRRSINLSLISQDQVISGSKLKLIGFNLSPLNLRKSVSGSALRSVQTYHDEFLASPSNHDRCHADKVVVFGRKDRGFESFHHRQLPHLTVLCWPDYIPKEWCTLLFHQRTMIPIMSLGSPFFCIWTVCHSSNSEMMSACPSFQMRLVVQPVSLWWILDYSSMISQ